MDCAVEFLPIEILFIPLLLVRVPIANEFAEDANESAPIE